MRQVTVTLEELEQMARESPEVAEALERLRVGHRRNVRRVVGRFVVEAVVLLALMACGLAGGAAALHKVKGCHGESVACAQR